MNSIKRRICVIPEMQITCTVDNTMKWAQWTITTGDKTRKLYPKSFLFIGGVIFFYGWLCCSSKKDEKNYKGRRLHEKILSETQIEYHRLGVESITSNKIDPMY
jgi:hypothetical protein